MSKAARAAQVAEQDQDTEQQDQEEGSTEKSTTTTEATDKTTTTEGEEGQATEGQQGAEQDGEGGFDVVEEGQQQTQAARTIPLTTYRKKVEKFKRRVERARGDAASASAENELLKLENQQLKERLAAGQKTVRPKRADFADDAAFETAEDKWLDEQVQTRVVKTLTAAGPATAPAAQAEDEPENDPKLRAHYERADKLKASDFEQREDEVIGVLGQQAVRTIITKFPNSEAVLYALGGNPKKLKEVAAAMKSDPVQAVIDLTDYARSLKLTPRTKAPDPDNAERGSVGAITDAQKQLDRMREEQASGKRRMKDVLDFKAECRKKGIKVE